MSGDIVRTAGTDAERSLLGAILILGRPGLEAAAGVSSEHFELEAHRVIFRAICETEEEGLGIDLTTVVSRLDSSGEIERAGGGEYVAMLESRVPDVENIPSYARLVVEAAAKRDGVAAAERLKRALSNGRPPAEAFVEFEKTLVELKARSRVALVPAVTPEPGYAVPCPTIAEALREPEPPVIYRIEGVLTEDDVMQLVSEPWAGKTAFLIGLALHLAAGRDFCGLHIPEAAEVFFWPAEGSRKKFKERVRVAAINYGIELDGLPLRISQKGLRPSDFRSPAFREVVAVSRAKVVICDTRRFFAPDAEENSADDLMKFVVIPLKGIATDLGVAFILTTHFGHPNEKRSGPRKARGTSAQEGDFDVCCTLASPNGKAAPERVVEWDKIRDEPERPPLPLLFEKGRHVFTPADGPVLGDASPKESRAKEKLAVQVERDRKAKEDIAHLFRRTLKGLTAEEVRASFNRERNWVADVLGEFHAKGYIERGVDLRENKRGQIRRVHVWKSATVAEPSLPEPTIPENLSSEIPPHTPPDLAEPSGGPAEVSGDALRGGVRSRQEPSGSVREGGGR